MGFRTPQKGPLLLLGMESCLRSVEDPLACQVQALSGLGFRRSLSHRAGKAPHSPHYLHYLIMPADRSTVSNTKTTTVWGYGCAQCGRFRVGDVESPRSGFLRFMFLPLVSSLCYTTYNIVYTIYNVHIIRCLGFRISGAGSAKCHQHQR